MLKNIIGAVVGAQLAKKSSKVDNGTGAIIGSIAPAIIARMSLPTMIAIGAGGYLLKRYRDDQARGTTTGTDALTGSSAKTPQPATAPVASI